MEFDDMPVVVAHIPSAMVPLLNRVHAIDPTKILMTLSSPWAIPWPDETKPDWLEIVHVPAFR